MKNFAIQNKSDLNYQKVGKLDAPMFVIQNIHSRLRTQRNILKDNLHLDKIYKHLSEKL